jgi:hypothetical protein
VHRRELGVRRRVQQQRQRARRARGRPFIELRMEDVRTRHRPHLRVDEGLAFPDGIGIWSAPGS